MRTKLAKTVFGVTLALVSVLGENALGHAAPRVSPPVTCNTQSTLLGRTDKYFTLDGISDGGLLSIGLWGSYSNAQGQGSNCIFYQVEIQVTKPLHENDLMTPAQFGLNEYTATCCNANGGPSGPYGFLGATPVKITGGGPSYAMTVNGHITILSNLPCVAMQDGTSADTNFISYKTGEVYSVDNGPGYIPLTNASVCPTS
jgi:hypothetical protein